jgi:hypothetical protein
LIVSDLDGQFANFVGATCKLFEQKESEVTTWNYFKQWGISHDDFWAEIHGLGDEFYRDLVRPYPWALDLLGGIQQTGDEWLIMSAPSDSPYGYAGKKIWVDEYLQPYAASPIKLQVGEDKYLLANENTLLIDDCDANVDMFRLRKGNAITFPQPWNFLDKMECGYKGYIENSLRLWGARV